VNCISASKTRSKACKPWKTGSARSGSTTKRPFRDRVLLPAYPPWSSYSNPTLKTLPPLEKDRKLNANTVTIDLPADDESETSYSNATVTDNEDDEHLSLDELAKCAKHDQKLLKHITQLQRNFHVSQDSRPHRKRRVHKIYQRFRQKFELDLKVVHRLLNLSQFLCLLHCRLELHLWTWS
jgi:hypothetical protein